MLAGTSLSLAQQRQRRVFTNEDVSPTPPAAAATPAPAQAAPAEAPAEGAAPADAAASGFEEPPADPNLPPGLALSNFLQGALRRFHTEFADRLAEETDPARQERIKLMMQLTMQLLMQNTLYINDLQAQQQQAEQQAQSQGAAQPAQ
jgi:hypothetical protein